MRSAGLRHVQVNAASVLDADRARAGALAVAAPAYDVLRRVPIVGRCLTWAGPLLEASAEGSGDAGVARVGASAAR